MTPLHVAAEKGHDRIVEYLIDLGAEINAEDNDGVGILDNNWQFKLTTFSTL